MPSSQDATDLSLHWFNRLAYLGVLPFVLGLWMQWSGVSFGYVDGRFLFAAYSCAILSFLCGVWWGGALNAAHHPAHNKLMYLSNGLCLLGWVGLLLYRTPVGLLLLLLCYVFVERMEAYLKPNRRELRSYFRTRTRVTYLVVACHLAMVLLLIAGG
ncbi:DUF3429 domain-containing protein [Microbulbifer agarilyticus]|uniref:DUF3429 domain-containing protein n=1 Tax=Microbulbifer agarilyticus TaxID=260552 RepID=A0A1Q2M412_9GAMM|nr:DUF3429 domain-containing protein [Microbulbifer agarilyticus]AQQ67441.1 DUF3429 domain-containing protein [Microbulbifer agarilyticus]